MTGNKIVNGVILPLDQADLEKLKNIPFPEPDPMQQIDDLWLALAQAELGGESL